MELTNDIKYVVCGKSNRDVDVYIAPYIQPIKSDVDIHDLMSLTKTLKHKSGFEWKVVLRDVDTDNKFIPVETGTDFDRELPVLSMELYQYTREFTIRLREGDVPLFNREQIRDKTPAMVYAMILTCNKEYQIIVPVTIYLAIAEACAEYYGDYNNLPWGIKRALSSHTQQLHIRLCDNSEMTYAKCMSAMKANDVKISPVMDCIDVETSMRETVRFGTILSKTSIKYIGLPSELDNDKPQKSSLKHQGYRLGST
jgi:hypothetical protein